MLKRILWNNKNEPVMTSIDAIMDGVRDDDIQDGLLYDAPTMSDILSGADMDFLDGIVVNFVKLRAKMLAMKRIMNTQANDEQQVVGDPIISDPFMRLGTAQVAVLFQLKDGQAITIYFHNPDSDPKKIKPNDPLVSFKFLLNKKDVTIVVAAEKGREINVREVAMRVMKLANKNSAAFLRQNKKAAERKAMIEELTKTVETKKGILVKKLKEIEVLEAVQEQAKIDKELDEKKNTNIESEEDFDKQANATLTYIKEYAEKHGLPAGLKLDNNGRVIEAAVINSQKTYRVLNISPVKVTNWDDEKGPRIKKYIITENEDGHNKEVEEKEIQTLSHDEAKQIAINIIDKQISVEFKADAIDSIEKLKSYAEKQGFLTTQNNLDDLKILDGDNVIASVDVSATDNYVVVDFVEEQERTITTKNHAKARKEVINAIKKYQRNALNKEEILSDEIREDIKSHIEILKNIEVPEHLKPYKNIFDEEFLSSPREEILLLRPERVIEFLTENYNLLSNSKVSAKDFIKLKNKVANLDESDNQRERIIIEKSTEYFFSKEGYDLDIEDESTKTKHARFNTLAKNLFSTDEMNQGQQEIQQEDQVKKELKKEQKEQEDRARKEKAEQEEQARLAVMSDVLDGYPIMDFTPMKRGQVEKQLLNYSNINNRYYQTAKAQRAQMIAREAIDRPVINEDYNPPAIIWKTKESDGTIGEYYVALRKLSKAAAEYAIWLWDKNNANNAEVKITNEEKITEEQPDQMTNKTEGKSKAEIFDIASQEVFKEVKSFAISKGFEVEEIENRYFNPMMNNTIIVKLNTPVIQKTILSINVDNQGQSDSDKRGYIVWDEMDGREDTKTVSHKRAKELAIDLMLQGLKLQKKKEKEKLIEENLISSKGYTKEQLNTPYMTNIELEELYELMKKGLNWDELISRIKPIVQQANLQLSEYESKGTKKLAILPLDSSDNSKAKFEIRNNADRDDFTWRDLPSFIINAQPVDNEKRLMYIAQTVDDAVNKVKEIIEIAKNEGVNSMRNNSLNKILNNISFENLYKGTFNLYPVDDTDELLEIGKYKNVTSYNQRKLLNELKQKYVEEQTDQMPNKTLNTDQLNPQLIQVKANPDVVNGLSDLAVEYINALSDKLKKLEYATSNNNVMEITNVDNEKDKGALVKLNLQPLTKTDKKLILNTVIQDETIKIIKNESLTVGEFDSVPQAMEKMDELLSDGFSFDVNNAAEPQAVGDEFSEWVIDNSDKLIKEVKETEKFEDYSDEVKKLLKLEFLARDKGGFYAFLSNFTLDPKNFMAEGTLQKVYNALKGSRKFETMARKQSEVIERFGLDLNQITSKEFSEYKKQFKAEKEEKETLNQVESNQSETENKHKESLQFLNDVISNNVDVTQDETLERLEKSVSELMEDPNYETEYKALVDEAVEAYAKLTDEYTQETDNA